MQSIAAYYVAIAVNQERRAIERVSKPARATFVQRVRAFLAANRTAPAAAAA